METASNNTSLENQEKALSAKVDELSKKLNELKIKTEGRDLTEDENEERKQIFQEIKNLNTQRMELGKTKQELDIDYKRNLGESSKKRDDK